jgi:hypothetical protein
MRFPPNERTIPLDRRTDQRLARCGLWGDMGIGLAVPRACARQDRPLDGGGSVPNRCLVQVKGEYALSRHITDFRGTIE